MALCKKAKNLSHVILNNYKHSKILLSLPWELRGANPTYPQMTVYLLCHKPLEPQLNFCNKYVLWTYKQWTELKLVK